MSETETEVADVLAPEPEPEKVVAPRRPRARKAKEFEERLRAR